MRFATATQLILLTAVACAGLYALDYFKNPQLWHPVSAANLSASRGIRLTLWMNHLCCTGCLADIRQALAGVPGLDLGNAAAPKQLLTQAQANLEKSSLPDYGNFIELPVTDIHQLDLVALDKALRNAGFVAGRMELAGVEHFRLQAEVNHMCCGMCERATHEQITFLKAKGAAGQFRWLDSMSVDREKKQIIAYARYLEPGHSVDIGEFIAGLNYVGYAPISLRVLIGEEKQEMKEMSTSSHKALSQNYIDIAAKTNASHQDDERIASPMHQ